MKNYNHISKMMLSAFAALMLSSCDDYLKETSPDLLIPEKVEEFQSVLNGEGYLFTYTGNRPNTFANDADFVHLMTDDVEVVTTTDSRSVLPDEDDLPALQQGRGAFTWAQDIEYYDVSYDGFYNRRYTNIMACNIVIENAETMKGERDKVASCVAQAYTLRALCYFYLVNLYGKPYNAATAATDMGVVLRLKSEIVRDQPARNTVKEVYDQINSDLDKALSYWEKAAMSSNKHLVSERATQLLKSRVALFTGDWDTAIEYGTKLSDGNYDLYNIGKIPSEELRMYDAQEDYVFINPNSNTEIIFTFGQPDYNANKFMSWAKLISGAMFSVSQTEEGSLLSLYEEGDQRLDAFFLQPVTNKGEYYDYRRAPYKRYSSKYYSTALRTSEALLNAAEAHVQKGSETDRNAAIRLLNLLRKNRFTPETYKELTLADFATNAELLQFVRDERRRELCFEEIHRWADLRRYGCPSLKHVYYASRNASPEVYVLEQGDQNYTLELPKSELDYNTVIESANRRAILPQ